MPRTEPFEKQDRMGRLYRVIRALQLSQIGLTTREIAGRTGVSQRQAQRDLIALESEMDVPLMQNGPRYSIMESYWLPPVNFTLAEGVGLLLAARLMARHLDRRNTHVADALEKLAAILPEAVRGAVAEVAQDVAGDRPADDTYMRVFTAVARAWAERRKLRITYTTERTWSRTVWPLFLEATTSGHGSYLIAWDQKLKAPRSYRLERISEAVPLEERFDPPLGFSVARMLAGAWGIWSGDQPVEVVLDFSPAVARRMRETRWHPTQRVDALPRGGVRVTLVVSSTVELRSWILGWGRECRVVAPASLERDVAAELREAAALYDARPVEAAMLSLQRGLPVIRPARKGREAPQRKPSTQLPA